MSDHTWMRLEKNGQHTDPNTGQSQASAVVAYLAPEFQLIPDASNDLFSKKRAKGDAPIVRDFLRVGMTVQIQGAFLDGEDLPSAHRADVESILGTSPVTSLDQALRVWHYMLKIGGPFELYWGDVEYTATSDSQVDYAAGVFPAVNIKRYRPVDRSGRTAREWFLELDVGVSR